MKEKETPNAYFELTSLVYIFLDTVVLVTGPSNASIRTFLRVSTPDPKLCENSIRFKQKALRLADAWREHRQR